MDRLYYPDFILRIASERAAVRPAGRTTQPPPAEPLQLIVEVTGMKRDKPEKKWAVEDRWLPAVHAVRAQRGWPRWAFLELDEGLAVQDARNQIFKKGKEDEG